ncbi:helix-turn-helix domain-containing protein [Streptomyces sp. CG1]|uniref:helix-turn-helix domain-containing protein n=1 Tax=Streptomyces sp. CG1 TaxID=1287523 RepID=UPI0034E20DC3
MHRSDVHADTAAAVRVRRADGVLEMQRLARRGGIPLLLRRLGARTGADVLLMDSAGGMASPLRTPLGDAQGDIALRAVRELTVRGLKSVTIDHDGLTCIALPLDGPRGVGMPVLAAVFSEPTAPEVPLLLADATSALSLSWMTEHTRQQQRRLQLADARIREAVVHLLMNGQVTVARQIAGTLRPTLPATIRVYVIEAPPGVRSQVADELSEAAERAWVVPCPVYANHMFVLAPAGSEAHPGHAAKWTRSASLTADCCIGVSDVVPLRDTATGYAQAFHALAAARHRTERQSSFTSNPDLALTIGPEVVTWARGFLAPIHSHRARRPQDPGGAELLATLASWLSFSSRATAHLKIHRNTLSARLASIQELLDLDLGGLADQAALALALRAIAAEGSAPPQRSAGQVPSLDELLQLPHVTAWAEHQFRPLRAAGIPMCIPDTLATWLRLDARIVPTAAALSLSTSAVRKRLTRSESLLQRSLLRPPSAVHDLWLAQRSLDLTARKPAPA